MMIPPMLSKGAVKQQELKENIAGYTLVISGIALLILGALAVSGHLSPKVMIGAFLGFGAMTSMAFALTEKEKSKGLALFVVVMSIIGGVSGGAFAGKLSVRGLAISSIVIGSLVTVTVGFGIAGSIEGKRKRASKD